MTGHGTPKDADVAVSNDDDRSLTAFALPPRPAVITRDERLRRIKKAQSLMREQGFGVLLIEPGSSLVYFTGIDWWRSDRLTCALIPAEGEICIVTPDFDEPSIRENLQISAEFVTWLEHENPFILVADWLTKRKGAEGTIGIEDTARYFIPDGLRQNLPAATLKNGAQIVWACRMFKTSTEIALLKHANDITIEAYRLTIPQIAAGMQPDAICRIMKNATIALGGKSEFEIALVGTAAAYPHGTREPQIVKPGDIILMDCGCSVDGYQSDISRTFVYGTANVRQRRVWAEVKAGQEAVFEAAQIGAIAGDVDSAVRDLYERLGYGPGYTTPGLSHRTGHAIGLDGHEPICLVRGETTKLAPGMCFSNEPGIYIPGEFGVRLEDCFYLDENGPQWFTSPSVSIDEPV